MTNDPQKEARRVARELIGRTLHTLGQNKPNIVEGVSDAGVQVYAKSSDTVLWEWIDAVIDELAARRKLAQMALKLEGLPGFQRGAFIFTFLAETSFAEQVADAPTITLKWI